MKRFFDIIASFIGIALLTPVWLILCVAVLLSGRGGIFFKQQRVGRNGVDFNLYKFRSMRPDAESKGQLTVGSRDPRITRVGYFLRKTKLDELPQLFNVLIGDMSFVGPRPEVRKYVAMYSDEQKEVLNVRPGITDLASLEYFEESDLLAKSQDPEDTYIKEIMPAKLEINLKYMKNRSLAKDIGIIFQTLGRIFGRGKRSKAN